MFNFRIFTPLSSRDSEKLVTLLNIVVDRFSAERPDDIGSVGTLSASDETPDIKSLSKIFPQMTRPLAARLESCESVLAIDEPGSLESEPVLVSLLRYILRNAGGSVIDWGGLTIGGDEIETGEAALVHLERFDHADAVLSSFLVPNEAFTDASETNQDGTAAAAESPQDILRERLIEILTRAQIDLDFGADVRTSIDEASPVAKAYMKIMVGSGELVDAEVAKALKVPAEKLPAVRSEIEELLDGFGD